MAVRAMRAPTSRWRLASGLNGALVPPPTYSAGHRGVAAPHGGAVDGSADDEEAERREERQERPTPTRAPGDEMTTHLAGF